MKNALSDAQLQRDRKLFEELRANVEGVYRACQQIAKRLDEDPRLWELWPERIGAWLKPALLHTFYNVGKDLVNPSLLLARAEAWAKKLIECPKAQQDQYVDQPIQILTRTAEGERIVSKLAPSLTTKELQQVFGRETGRMSVRTINQQGQYLEIAESARGRDQAPYVIRDGWLQVSKPCSFNRDMLLQLLQALDSENSNDPA